MVLAGYTYKVIKNVKEAEEYVIRIYLWSIQQPISSCHQPVEELVSFLYLLRFTLQNCLSKQGFHVSSIAG